MEDSIDLSGDRLRVIFWNDIALVQGGWIYSFSGGGWIYNIAIRREYSTPKRQTILMYPNYIQFLRKKIFSEHNIIYGSCMW